MQRYLSDMTIGYNLQIFSMIAMAKKCPMSSKVLKRDLNALIGALRRGVKFKSAYWQNKVVRVGRVASYGKAIRQVFDMCIDEKQDLEANGIRVYVTPVNGELGIAINEGANTVFMAPLSDLINRDINEVIPYVNKLLR